MPKTQNMFIALDVDGVLMDCYPPINKALIQQFSLPTDYRMEKIIKTWNFLEYKEDMRKFVLECFGDPAIVENYNFKPGVVKFVKELHEIAKQRGGKLIFNTHCFNQAVGDVRKKQLDYLCEKANINADYNISVGEKKINCESTIIIDDCLANLENSDAKLKILFGMFHNKYYRLPNRDTYKRSHDYNEIVRMVKTL